MEDSSRVPRLSAEDFWLTGAVTAVLAAIVTVAGPPFTPAPYVFALGFGAVLLLRRRLTGTVVLLSVLGTFAYYTLDLPAIGVALPVVGALFSAAEFGWTRIAIVAGALVFAVALAFRLRDDPQPVGTLLGTDAAANLGLLAAAIALGYGVRTRREYVAQQEQIARLREESARARAAQSVQAERSRISRELHDTVGHSLSVITLHAGVAGEAVGRDDGAAADAVEAIGRQSRESLRELRAMVRLLRAGDERDAERGPGAPGPLATVGDLEPLLSAVHTKGIEVRSLVDVPDELPHAVDTAAYRVVQEAFTNILRHAEGAYWVDLLIAEEHGEVRVRVVDDGRGRGSSTGTRTGTAGKPPAGTGLVGLAERVRLLGGTLDAGPADPTDEEHCGRGFVVEASIPIERNQ